LGVLEQRAGHQEAVVNAHQRRKARRAHKKAEWKERAKRGRDESLFVR
jgi:hypothetical protein